MTTRAIHLITAALAAYGALKFLEACALFAIVRVQDWAEKRHKAPPVESLPRSSSVRVVEPDPNYHDHWSGHVVRLSNFYDFDQEIA